MSRRSPILLLTILVVGVVPGQWSEPTVVADSVSLWAAGPALVATGGDTLWACWTSGSWPQALVARCLTGDTWRAIESVLGDSEIGVHWPAAVVDDSGRVMVACFLGDYPIDDPPPDTWGIYTVTRGPAGWEDPVLAHGMMGVYPVDICLGISNQSTVGMAWSEDYGGVNSMDSVMFSRRTQTGWTERKCLAPGRYPDVRCYGPTMVADDTTAFCLAHARWDSPGSYHIHIVAVDDTVVAGPTFLTGIAPVLARDSARKFLAFAEVGILFASVDYGTGWTAPVAISSGVSRWVKASLCVDVMGYAWACWYDSVAGLIKASYSRGHAWSEPETVATASSWLTIELASDGYGSVHCLWVDNSTLKHAYRLELPGVEERERTKRRDEGARMGPGICRGVMFYQPAAGSSQRTAELIDINGRLVISLQPGENDIRHLAPGVYFVRRPETEDGRPSTAARKVVIQR